MTKETIISTFLPIVNIGSLPADVFWGSFGVCFRDKRTPKDVCGEAKTLESARNQWNPKRQTRNKTPKNQRSFPAANPIPRNWQPAKFHVNHLRCLTFGSPLSSMSVVYLQFTPTIFSYDWVAFLKSASSFDFEQWKKRSHRMKRNCHRR